MTLRWVVVHMMELPMESRIKKHFGGDKAIFDMKDHLIADVRDLLMINQYFTSVTALKGMKMSDQQKVLRGMPRRSDRPGEEKPKPRFATPEELAMLFASDKTKRALMKRRRKQQP